MFDRFVDRENAGRALAHKLLKYKGIPDLLIIGLPRGGVVVAFEVARALQAQMDVFIVRKLGAPYQPELAMGAVAEGGILLLNDAVVKYLSISKEFIDQTAKEQMVELERRQKLYRGDREMTKIAGRTVIVVDDGLATGATMKVAVRALKRKEPSKLVIAVPLGAFSTCSELKKEADELICLMTPEPFSAVGSWYENFEQTTDQQVRELLQKAHDLHSGHQSSQKE